MDKNNVNIYDYILIINEKEHIKTLCYNDSSLTLKQRLNYDIINNNTSNIQFIPNPIINNEYKILNVILSYSFINCSFKEKLKLTDLLNINIYKYLNSYIYNYIYQISLNSNFCIDIFVRLFDYPVSVDYFNSNNLNKIILELKTKLYNLLIQDNIDNFKNKFIPDKSNLIKPYYLYPFIRPGSLMHVQNNQEFVSDKSCILLQNNLNSIRPYFDLDDLNQQSQINNTVNSNKCIYNIKNKKIQRIITVIQKWNDILITTLSKTKYKEKDKFGYDNKLISYIPLIIDKKSNDLILGITSNSVNNRMILDKLSNDFRVKILKYKNIDYIATYNFLTIINDNNSIANYFNITTDKKAILKDDLIQIDTFYRNHYMQTKVDKIIKRYIHKLYKIDEPIIYNEQTNKIDYNLFLYCKNYINKIYKPYIFELHKKKRSYVNIIKNIFQNEDLNHYETIYAHTKIDGLVANNRIKTIDYPVKFGYWDNYIYQTKDNAFNIVKYPKLLNSKKIYCNNRDYLINTFRILNLDPVFMIFFLMRSILTQGNFYLSDCIFLHNNTNKTNFIKTFTNIMMIFKEVENDFVINRLINFDALKAFRYAYNQSIKYNNIFLSDYPDSKYTLKMLNSIVGKYEGKNIFTDKDNITYTLPNTNLIIFTNSDQYVINNILKSEYSIYNNSYYLLYYNIENNNISNFPNKQYNFDVIKNANMFKTVLKFCQDAIYKLKKEQKQYYDFNTLLNFIKDELKFDFDKDKFYIKLNEVKELKINNKKNIKIKG